MDFTEHEELQPLLDTVIPDDSSLPYDMHDVVRILLDEDSVMDCSPIMPTTLSPASAAWAGTAWA